MPQVQGQGNCQYTVLNTAGTTTLNPGPQQPPAPSIVPSQICVFFGLECIAPGTTFAVTVYDITPATPGGAAAGTNTLLSGTGTAGQFFAPGAAGVGVRVRGALVAVATGTPGAYNALWD